MGIIEEIKWLSNQKLTYDGISLQTGNNCHVKTNLEHPKIELFLGGAKEWVRFTDEKSSANVGLTNIKEVKKSSLPDNLVSMFIRYNDGSTISMVYKIDTRLHA